MVYGYIRVSTEKQTLENQRYEIERFCKDNGIEVDVWFEETISGVMSIDKRRLGALLKNVKEGDTLVATEISRFGRTLFMVMEILNICLEKGCRVWTIRDGYRLGDDLQSKVLAFAFGLSAEIERNFISQRTKEALARMKDEGRTLGRPYGSKNKRYKLDGKEDRIVSMLRRGKTYTAIAKRLGVHRGTIQKYIEVRGLDKIVAMNNVRPSVYFAKMRENGADETDENP